MDLKIAAIALVNDAMLLTCNLKDFQKVPETRVEDWLEDQRSKIAVSSGFQRPSTGPEL